MRRGSREFMFGLAGIGILWWIRSLMLLVAYAFEGGIPYSCVLALLWCAVTNWVYYFLR